MTGEAAVFLDRDGTINEDAGYLSDPGGLKIIAGATEAIKRLNERGIKVIVVTNQSGVGRGFCGDGDVEAVNKRLIEALGAGGAYVDGIYYCPHHPEDGCGCRKPEPGLARMAALEHGIALSRSYVVGDKATDIQLAVNMRAKGVLVLTGAGPDELKKIDAPPDFVARDILNAVEWIMDDMRGREGVLK